MPERCNSSGIVHEDYRDCTIPDTAEDGSEVVCDQCGLVWEYRNGWFEPTQRHMDTDIDRSGDSP